MKRIWTHERAAEAQRLWSDPDLTPEKIADAVGVTYQSLQVHAHRNRDMFPKREHPNARAKRLRLANAPAKPKEPPKPQYKRYQDDEQISIASDLWLKGIAIKSIHVQMKMGEKTFRKMRKFAPNRFPSRNDKAEAPKSTPFRKRNGEPITAQRGQGVLLRNGIGWLHLSGETLTTERAYAWRGTSAQAHRMIGQSDFDLTPISEGK